MICKGYGNDVMKATCGRCKYIIGMTDREHLSIKTSDFLIYVYGGMVQITCKLCNVINLIVDDEYEKQNAERVYKAEQNLNSVRAVFSRWIPSKHYGDRPPKEN